MTGGFGADYTFEATGNVERHAAGGRVGARWRWGLCTMIGVAGKGETLDIVPRFLITGRRVAGSSFGGVKGRARCRARRALARRRDRRRLVHLAPLTLDEVNRGFELMEAQDGIRSVIEFDEEAAMLISAPSIRRGPRTPTSSPTATAGTACWSTRTASRSRCSSAIERRRHHDHPRARHAPARRPRRRRRAARAALRRPAAGAPADDAGADGVDETFADGDVVALGRARDPGDRDARATAADHLALLVNGTDCLTADCLFKGTVGGTMGGGPSGYADQYDSIMDGLMGLPHETRIHPGHTRPTTIGDEWEQNPFIRIWRGLDAGGNRAVLGARRAGDADPLRARLRRHAQGVGALRRRPRRDRRPGRP